MFFILFKAKCIFFLMCHCRPSSQERKAMVDGGCGHLFVNHVETNNDRQWPQHRTLEDWATATVASQQEAGARLFLLRCHDVQ